MATIFQALSWYDRDIDDNYNIHVFGRTEDGKSVCMTTPFKPYFFVKIESDLDRRKLELEAHEACDKCIIK